MIGRINYLGKTSCLTVSRLFCGTETEELWKVCAVESMETIETGPSFGGIRNGYVRVEVTRGKKRISADLIQVAILAEKIYRK